MLCYVLVEALPWGGLDLAAEADPVIFLEAHVRRWITYY